MGQYYMPAILGVENEQTVVLAHLYSHDYGNGLKLMEHSYIGNNFVNAFESLLAPGSKYHKSPVVWAGDYADVDSDGLNVYDKCHNTTKPKPKFLIADNEFPFIVNHTKKQFVDKRQVPIFNEDWAIHPLPLLTCEGNGRGGGDYRGEDPKHLIGSWARDVISVESEVPEDYTELFFDLVEN